MADDDEVKDGSAILQGMRAVRISRVSDMLDGGTLSPGSKVAGEARVFGKMPCRYS